MPPAAPRTRLQPLPRVILPDGSSMDFAGAVALRDHLARAIQAHTPEGAAKCEACGGNAWAAGYACVRCGGTGVDPFPRLPASTATTPR